MYVRVLGFANHEPKAAVRDWDFGPERESELRKIFEDRSKSDDQKLKELYEKLWAARLETTNPVTRFFLRRPVKDSLRQWSIYSLTFGWALRKLMGPHYNPVFNRVAMGVSKVPTVTELIAASHELGHAFHRNRGAWEMAVTAAVAPKELLFAVLPRLVWPVMTFRMEGHSIGAQYEYVRRIPPEMRAKLVNQLKLQRIEGLDIKDRERQVLEKLETSGTVYLLREIYLKAMDLTEPTPADEALLGKILAFGVNHDGAYKRLLSFVDAYEDSHRAKSGWVPRDIKLRCALLRAVLKDGAVKMKLPAAAASLPPLTSFPPSSLHLEALGALGQSRLSKAAAGKRLFQELLRKIAIASLENAHLSKEEFVKKLRPLHNYDFEGLITRGANPSSGWRKILVLQAAAMAWLSRGQDADDIANTILAADIGTVVRWFGPKRKPISAEQAANAARSVYPDLTHLEPKLMMSWELKQLKYFVPLVDKKGEAPIGVVVVDAFTGKVEDTILVGGQ